jgi:hypothetical protein
VKTNQRQESAKKLTASQHFETLKQEVLVIYNTVNFNKLHNKRYTEQRFTFKIKHSEISTLVAVLEICRYHFMTQMS